MKTIMYKKDFFDVNNRKNLTWFYPKICKYQNKIYSENIFEFLEQSNPNIPLLLYIHIPFCESFCSYCACFKENFYAYTYEQRKQFVDSIIKELKRYFWTPYFKDTPVNYILFGGGSPSVLDNDLLEKILIAIHENCNLKDLKGISFEGNVMSLKDTEKLNLLKNYGVNRVSFGLQTFQADIRKFLNIKAPVADIYKCVDAINKVGIDHFALDKIYNLPGETEQTLENDLNRIYKDLKPSIIQTYRFNIFANTKLAQQIKNNKIDNPPSNIKEMAMFEYMQESMSSNGYDNQLFINMYTNSNDITDTGIELSMGKNCLYGSNMLGLGPGSMSYLSNYNYRNVCSVKDYIRLISENSIAVEAEYVIDVEEMENRVMTFFPNFTHIAKKDIPNFRRFKDKLDILIQNDLLIYTEHEYVLTSKGKLWAGNISYTFYSDIEKGRVQKSYINSLRHNKNPFNQDKMNV